MAGVWMFVPVGHNTSVVWIQPTIPQPPHANYYHPSLPPPQYMPPQNHHQVLGYTSYHQTQVYNPPPNQYIPPAQIYPQYNQHFHQAAPHQPYQYPSNNYGHGGFQERVVQRQQHPHVSFGVNVPWSFPGNASPALRRYLVSRWNQSQKPGQLIWRGVGLEVVSFRIRQGQTQEQRRQPNRQEPMPTHQPPPSNLNIASRAEKVDDVPPPAQEDRPPVVQEKTLIPRTPSPQIPPPNERQDAREQPTPRPLAIKARNTVHIVTLQIKREDDLPEANSNLANNVPEIKKEDEFENRTRTRLRSGTQAPQNYAAILKGRLATNSKKRKAVTVEGERKKPRENAGVKDEQD